MLVYNINISHSSVATPIKCDEKYGLFLKKNFPESVGEKVLTIDQYLAKIMIRVYNAIFESLSNYLLY